MAHNLARQVPFGRLLNWLMGLVPGSSKLVAMTQSSSRALTSSETEDFGFDADLGDLYEQEAAIEAA